MVTQQKHSKVSNAAERVRAEMKSLATAGERLEVYKANLDVFQELEKYDIRSDNRKLLLELANLHEEGWPRFTSRFPSAFRERSMYELRNDLRAIWERRLSVRKSNEALNGWLVWSTQIHAPEVFLPWVPDIRTGRLLPVWENLPARVVMAVLEHFPKLRKCANPDCAVPYFIANRKTQLFCERGECTRYAQSQYSLKSWRKKRQSQTTASERSNRGTRKTR